MTLGTKAIMNMERSTESERLSGPTGPPTSENSTTITFTVRVSTPGPIIENTKATGEQTKCMVKELSTGQTAENTLANTLKTKRKDMESSSGQMAGATAESG